MSLYEQMIVLLYHCIVGQVFGLLFSFLSLCLISFKSLFRTICFVLFSLCFTTLYYAGLYFINGGILHFYSFVVLSISFYLYYMFFYEYLISLFLGIKSVFRPIKRKFGIAKRKLYGIIIMSIKEK